MSNFISSKSILTEVGDSATSVTLTEYDSAKMGVTIWNDSSAILYIRVDGGVASATDWTHKLLADDYWEAPYSYCGKITGIWASDAGGVARVTDFF